MKKALLILALLVKGSVAFAQEAPVNALVAEPETRESKFTAGVDIVYPYLWRGIRYYGDKVAFQPYLSYAVTDKLSVGVWATTNFSNAADAYNEFDWNISYQLSPVLSVTLIDYYWPATRKNADWERSRYFDYSEGSAQTLDFSVLLNFTEKGVPIDFQWSTIVGGNDYKYDENDERTRAFSSYAEIGYTYSFEKRGIDVRPFVGAAVINGGYYGVDASGKAGFTFTNVGVNVAKEFKIADTFSLPVFIRYTNNDYGVQEFDASDNRTKTVRNFFSTGVTFTIR